MVEARDIIAKAVAVAWCGKGAPVDPIDNEAAHAAIAALSAAGWTLAPPGSRVVPEGGVDAPTVERCAREADHKAAVYQRLFDAGKGEHCKPGYVTDNTWATWHGKFSAFEEMARALRALAEAKP